MNVIKETIKRIVTDLQAAGARWALVGGLAVSARTTPRFTADIDIAIAVGGDPEAESLVKLLLEKGYRLSATVEQDAAGRLATARLLPPGEGPHPVIDILFASSGIEPEVVQDAEEIEIMPSLSLPTATIGHLLALKILSRNDVTRPQDRLDALALHGAASSRDLRTARVALELISSRGFDRGRDLTALLDDLEATAR